MNIIDNWRAVLGKGLMAWGVYIGVGVAFLLQIFDSLQPAFETILAIFPQPWQPYIRAGWPLALLLLRIIDQRLQPKPEPQ